MRYQDNSNNHLIYDQNRRFSKPVFTPAFWMLRLSVNLKSQSSVLISSTLKCVELGLFISLRMRTLFRLKLKGDEDGILVSGLEIQTKTRSVKILAYRIVRTSRKLGLGFSLSLHMTILEPGTDSQNLCSCSRSFMSITGRRFSFWRLASKDCF